MRPVGGVQEETATVFATCNRITKSKGAGKEAKLKTEIEPRENETKSIMGILRLNGNKSANKIE